MADTMKEKYFFNGNVSETQGTILDFYDFVKEGDGISSEELLDLLGISTDKLNEIVSICEKKRILEVSRSEEQSGPAIFRCRELDGKSFLGASFTKESCDLVVLDSRGVVSRKETLPVESLNALRGRVGEIKDVIKTISKTTGIKKIPLRMGGVVIHGALEGKDKKGVSIISDGFSRIFKCEIKVSRLATAAAYAENNKNPDVKGKNMLYIYSDTGEGVLVKGQQITESGTADSGPSSYLRAWEQFGAVKTTRDLINKGLGSDIVEMVEGDPEAISLSSVLRAADRNDELAVDLVKRSALALGVRAAYLTNICGIDLTVLGGGLEEPAGKFKEYMEESYDRFLLSGKAGKVKILRGVAGDQDYSMGAALLCRREIFAEVQ